MAQPLTPEQIKKYGITSSRDTQRDISNNDYAAKARAFQAAWKTRKERAAFTRPGYKPIKRTTPRGYIDKAKSRYKSFQGKISSKIPTLKQISQAGYKFGTAHPEFARRSVQDMEFLATGAKKYIPAETGKAVGESSVEFYKSVQKKPISTVGHIGAAYAGGAVIGGAAKGGALALRYGAKHTAAQVAKYGVVGRTAGTGIITGAKVIEPGIGIAGAGMMAHEFKGKTQKEMIKTGAYLGIGTFGAIKGFKTVGKAHEMWQTRGLKELPALKVMDPAVMAGEKQFPMIKAGQTPREFIGEFTKKEFLLPGEKPGMVRGWHAAPEISGKGYTGTKPVEYYPGTQKIKVEHKHDVPGTYVGPRASTYFLRMGDVYKSSRAAKTGLLELLVGKQSPLEPATVRYEIPSGISRIPEAFRSLEGKAGYTKAGEFLSSKAGTGKSYITPLAESKFKAGKGRAPEGIEAEITLAPSSKVQFIGKEFYFKDPSGHRIPVIQQRVLPAAKVKTTMPVKGKSTVKEIGKKYDIYEYSAKTYKSPKIYTRGYELPMSKRTGRRDDDPVRDIIRAAERRIDDRRTDARRDTRRTDDRRDDRRTDARRDTRRTDDRRGAISVDTIIPPPSDIKLFKLPEIESMTKKKKGKKKAFKEYDIKNPVPDILKGMGL